MNALFAASSDSRLPPEAEPPRTAASFNAWVVAKGYPWELSPHVSAAGQLEWALVPLGEEQPLLRTGETLESRAVAGALLFICGLEEGIALGNAQAQTAYDSDLAGRDAACDALLEQVLRLETIVAESESARLNVCLLYTSRCV